MQATKLNGVLFSLVAFFVIEKVDGFLPAAAAAVLRVSTHTFPSSSYHPVHLHLRSNLQDTKSNDIEDELSSKANTRSAQSASPSFADYRDAMTTRVIRRILDHLKDSDWIASKHEEHVTSQSVTHLFQNTLLAQFSDRYKLDFVQSWAGRALERVMREEQDYLEDWKVDKIVQAASSSSYDSEQDYGYYNATEARSLIRQQIYGGGATHEPGGASMTTSNNMQLSCILSWIVLGVLRSSSSCNNTIEITMIWW